MRTARWQVDNAALWIWFNDPSIEDRHEYIYIVREWMEEMGDGHPYILEDDFQDSWVVEYGSAYQGPKAIVKKKERRNLFFESEVPYLAFFGCDNLELLRSHEAVSELSWYGGLRVHYFESYEDVCEQLKAWDGLALEILYRGVRLPLMILSTGGDGEGLHMRPGVYGLTQLLDMAQRAAAKLGFDWGPL